jgi:hypothetical protein
MPTVASAAIAGVAYAALYAGHQIGDHAMQTSAAAAAKGAPTAERLAAGADPWAGWSACLRHVATYALVQALALGLVCLVAPLTLPGVVAALAVSASTHAVIDRRWPVRLLIRAKRCEGWREAPYLLDQSLHYGALLLAAVAATTSTAGGAVAVFVPAVTLVGAALVVERRQSIMVRPR